MIHVGDWVKTPNGYGVVTCLSTLDIDEDFVVLTETECPSHAVRVDLSHGRKWDGLVYEVETVDVEALVDAAVREADTYHTRHGRIGPFELRCNREDGTPILFVPRALAEYAGRAESLREQLGCALDIEVV